MDIRTPMTTSMSTPMVMRHIATSISISTPTSICTNIYMSINIWGTLMCMTMNIRESIVSMSTIIRSMMRRPMSIHIAKRRNEEAAR
jgi:hypothetical protein